MRWGDCNNKLFEEIKILSKGTCIIPLGALEQHGQHLPLRTDMSLAAAVADRIAEKETVMVFEDFYFAQLSESMASIGTIIIDNELLLKLLENICDEIARHGFNKIILISGHFGNIDFIRFFTQTMLRKQKKYVIYLMHCVKINLPIKENKDINSGGHAGIGETSIMMNYKPALIRMQDIDEEKICSGNELDSIFERFSRDELYSPIWWKAKRPWAYSGPEEGIHYSNKEHGEICIDEAVKRGVEIIKIIKNDEKALEFLTKFYEKYNEGRQ